MKIGRPGDLALAAETPYPRVLELVRSGRIPGAKRAANGRDWEVPLTADSIRACRQATGADAPDPEPKPRHAA